MATQADIGNGTKFQIESGTPGTYTDIAEVFDITPPNETTDVIDASHMGSPMILRARCVSPRRHPFSWRPR